MCVVGDSCGQADRNRPPVCVGDERRDDGDSMSPTFDREGCGRKYRSTTTATLTVEQRLTAVEECGQDDTTPERPIHKYR